MNHVFSVGKQKDIKHFYSHVSITARPFYEHMGFSVAKRATDGSAVKRLKNFLMIKTSIKITFTSFTSF